ncbi:hypothetical protein ACH47V_32920 [Micromonospora chersina]
MRSKTELAVFMLIQHRRRPTTPVTAGALLRRSPPAGAVADNFR